jgi:DNA-binding NtrC family response regulator
MNQKREPIALIGESPALEAIRAELEYASRCDAKVLITGESGVGKEVVARLIHARSRRQQNPMVTVNCAALTETLLETELFGHVRGSFTGATRDRSGVLEVANRGTVFMDEIGETTPRMQGLLLRFLETGEIQRVGSDRADARVDVRVIAATNRNLVASVQDKTFREDLYYRLNVIHMRMPSLRERISDIPLLLARFCDQFAREHGVPTPQVSPAALELLLAHPWPGNVREQKNVVDRMIVRHRAGAIEPEDLPVEVLAKSVEAAPQPLGMLVTTYPRADELFDRMVNRRERFWTAVYPLFMARDLTRDDIRALVRKGLERTSGDYRVLTELFNMPADDYKRFLNFLRKHQCQEEFPPLGTAGGRDDDAENGDGTSRKTGSAASGDKMTSEPVTGRL